MEHVSNNEQTVLYNPWVFSNYIKVVVQPARTKELDINMSFAYQVLNVIGQMPTL